MSTKITVLVDEAAEAPLQSEFGLSLLISRGGRPILFDTGAGQALIPNLRALGIPPESLHDVVLSHGHSDHTGGLAGLSPQRIWCCRRITAGHFKQDADGALASTAMPEAARAVLAKSEVSFVDGFVEIASGVWLTGPLPRIARDDWERGAFCDRECRMRDSVQEETALLSEDGVLVTGCCHAGLFNTLTYCRKVHPEIDIHTLVGGLLHLANAEEERLADAVGFLRDSGVRRLVLLHCTGPAAAAYLAEHLPECRVEYPRPGETLTL